MSSSSVAQRVAVGVLVMPRRTLFSFLEIGDAFETTSTQTPWASTMARAQGVGPSSVGGQGDGRAVASVQSTRAVAASLTLEGDSLHVAT